MTCAVVVADCSLGGRAKDTWVVDQAEKRRRRCEDARMSAVPPYSFVARNIDPEADNEIHADDVAQRLGFAGALVPGVELFAGATTPLVAHWGERWLAGGQLALRFRRPVYDGERVEVALHEGSLTLTGPGGDVRGTGSAGLLDRPPQVHGQPHVPLPAAPSAEPADGPFGTVVEPVSAADGEAYLEAVGEPLALYRDAGIAHPGLLLRQVNLLLMRNVALGPWIHTASSCRLLGVATLPAQMTVSGTVTDRYERNGHAYVRYDALVQADGRAVMLADHTAIHRIAR